MWLVTGVYFGRDWMRTGALVRAGRCNCIIILRVDSLWTHSFLLRALLIVLAALGLWIGALCVIRTLTWCLDHNGRRPAPSAWLRVNALFRHVLLQLHRLLIYLRLNFWLLSGWLLVSSITPTADVNSIKNCLYFSTFQSFPLSYYCAPL